MSRRREFSGVDFVDLLVVVHYHYEGERIPKKVHPVDDAHPDESYENQDAYDITIEAEGVEFDVEEDSALWTAILESRAFKHAIACAEERHIGG